MKRYIKASFDVPTDPDDWDYVADPRLVSEGIRLYEMEFGNYMAHIADYGSGPMDVTIYDGMADKEYKLRGCRTFDQGVKAIKMMLEQLAGNR